MHECCKPESPAQTSVHLEKKLLFEGSTPRWMQGCFVWGAGHPSDQQMWNLHRHNFCSRRALGIPELGVFKVVHVWGVAGICIYQYLLINDSRVPPKGQKMDQCLSLKGRCHMRAQAAKHTIP